MNGQIVENAIQRGNAIAARSIGRAAMLHRPRGAGSPLRSSIPSMPMLAHFAPSGARTATYGHPLYDGIFDAGRTRPGDYLVADAGTWFIASQGPLQPALCVLAQRVVSFARAQIGGAVGLATYGGLRRANAAPLLTQWPASVISARGGVDRAGLPGDLNLAGWSVLLPAVARIQLRASDLMTDDLGRAGVVTSAELSELGWRLLVRQAAT